MVLPIVLNSFTDHFQAFSGWHLLVFFLRKPFVECVKPWMVWVVIFDLRRRVVKGLPPLLDLFLSVLLASFLLGLSLKFAIVTLI